MSLFSICIATRNRSAYLARHIRHISSFETLDYELIVSDNNSEDDTPMVVAELARANPRIHYVRQQTPLNSLQSISASCALAVGRYMMFIADDDYVIESGLLRAAEIMEKHQSVAAIYGDWHPIQPGEAVGEALEAGSNTSNREDRVFSRHEMVELYSGNWQMELPIFRRDIYSKSHLPYHFHMPFDFYGMARFLGYGQVMMMRDCIALVEQHADQNSKNIYHDELIYSYLSDYELFCCEMRNEISAEVHDLIASRLVRQYMWAGEKAAMDGKFLLGKHFMQKALGYQKEETNRRAARYSYKYLTDMIAEAIVQFTQITPTNSTLVFEAHPILAIIMEKVRLQIAGTADEYEFFALSLEDFIKRPLQEDDVYIALEEETRQRREVVQGVPTRKFRSLEQFMHACRV